MRTGRSVGFALTVDLWSLVFSTGILEDLAFTGEISIHGDIWKVWVIKQKIEGAWSARIKTIFIPIENHKDFKYLSKSSKEKINIKFIRNVDEVLTLLFQDRTSSAQMGGITEEFIKKLSEKVNLLTMERKGRAKGRQCLRSKSRPTSGSSRWRAATLVSTPASTLPLYPS